MKKQVLTILTGGLLIGATMTSCGTDCTSEVNEVRAECDERVADAVEAVHAEWDELYNELYADYEAAVAQLEAKGASAPAPRSTPPPPPKEEPKTPTDRDRGGATGTDGDQRERGGATGTGEEDQRRRGGATPQ